MGLNTRSYQFWLNTRYMPEENMQSATAAHTEAFPKLQDENKHKRHKL